MISKPTTDGVPALEELRAIRRMIAETRRSAERHWIGLVIWGVPGLIACLISNYFLATGRAELIGTAWLGFLVTGLLLTIAYSLRERGRARVVTVAARILDVTWAAVLMTLLTIVGSGAVEPLHVPGVIALVLASGLCVMGAVLEFRPLYAAAVLWWVGGIAMTARPGEAFLIEAALLVLGYLFPAALLWRATARDDVDGTPN